MAHFEGNKEAAQIDWAAKIKSGAYKLAHQHGFLFEGSTDVAKINWTNILKDGAYKLGHQHGGMVAGINIFKEKVFTIK